MFEWLEHEISTIKTIGFHVVDGPADAQLREAVTSSSFSVPSSYRQFVLKFGNAKLYKNFERNSYRIGIFASPRQSVLTNGTPIYRLGFHDGASVYVKPPFDDPERLPIFEFEDGD